MAARLRWLLRRHWPATVAFAIAAGLAGGIPLAAWDAARRADRVFDRFLAVTDSPELNVTFCPPGVTSAADAALETCLLYDPQPELAIIRRLPEVAAAARAAVRTGVVHAAASSEPEQVIFISAVRDPDLVTPLGRPLVLAGRAARPTAPDEVMVNEAFLRQYQLRLGDRLMLQGFAAGETDRTPATERRSPVVPVRIVGVVRTLDDLSADNRGGPASASATVFTRPGVDARMSDAAPFYAAILVQARGGDAAQARTAIERAFPNRLLNDQYGTSADDVIPLQDAYHYEAQAARAVAALTALAALVFVGQALARQVRREWADAAVLRSIGLSPRQAGLTAAGRGLAIGVGATVLAATLVVGLSPLEPVGHARQAALERGVRLDGLVLAVGPLLILLIVVLVATVPAWRLAAVHGRVDGGSALRRVPTTGMRPPMAAGVGMAVNGGRGGVGLPVGAAMAGVVLAAAVLVVAAGLVASIEELVATPARYGAPWDRSISGLQAGEPEGVRAHLGELAGIDAAAAMYGGELVIGGESGWTIALDQIDAHTAPISPTITRGREPIRPSEIALGERTLRRLHAAIGDEVPVEASIAGASPQWMTIVGTAVMNATDEGSPGLGAILSAEGFRRVSPGAEPSIFVATLADGSEGATALADLESAYPTQLSAPVRQPAVRNLARLRPIPWLLAGIVAAFAAGSLAHALLLLVRRHRRHLAVLKTLGFTRAQVTAAVAWQTTTLVAVALVAGLIAGVLAARLAWRSVADHLGVVSPAVVPVAPLLLVAVGVLGFANLVATWPARRAASVRPADALRAE